MRTLLDTKLPKPSFSLRGLFRVEWAEYEYADDIDVFKVNVDEQPEYVKQFNVNALPHLVLFQNGEDVSHITGLIKKAELSKHIQQYI